MSLGINSVGQVSVGNTATSIIAGNGLRDSLVICNIGTQTVFLGNASVTAATGHALPAGAAVTLTVESPVYGIVASSTATITFLEEQ
jgi:hypothetical protein